MLLTTTEPATTRGPQTTVSPLTSTVRDLELRTITCFVGFVPYPHLDYRRRQYDAWMEKGRQLISLAAAELPENVTTATLRLVPPMLDSLLAGTANREEAFQRASAQFQLREALADELNALMPQFGLLETSVFVGGFAASSCAVPRHAFDGFLDAVIYHLAKSKWQFGVAHLGGGSDAIEEYCLQRTSETIAALGVGGTRFCAMFGDADFTPFCPCASHNSALEGISIGMSGPGLLYEAAMAAATPDAAEEAVRSVQRDALIMAGAVGQKFADAMGVAFFGIDPSQAPVFIEAAPRSQSIGAVIEAFSRVPLGKAGTKDGFFRLMRGLRRGGTEAGVRLCGFQGGSFLPVAEDAVVAMAVGAGDLTYTGILDLCHICAAGMDMIVVVPGTAPSTIAHVLRDVAVTHLIKGKALAVRLIVPGPDTPCDERGWYVFGGLLGSAPVLPIN